MGRQRLGLLTLHNQPMFVQNLKMGWLTDRRRANRPDWRSRDGVPRFNEFRRQYGLRQLTSYDDFMDPRPDRPTAATEDMVRSMREVYGQHIYRRT